jgi:hypothetical protein
MIKGFCLSSLSVSSNSRLLGKNGLFGGKGRVFEAETTCFGVKIEHPAAKMVSPLFHRQVFYHVTLGM